MAEVDPWAAFPDAPAAPPSPEAADPWAAFSDAPADDASLGTLKSRVLVGATKPAIGAGQIWAHGGADIAGRLWGEDSMVARGGHKIANLLDVQADKFADWARRGRVAAGLGEEAELFKPSTWDVPGMIGETLSPVNLAAGGLAGRAVGGVLGATMGRKAAGSLAERVSQGAGYGAAYGATAPITSQDLAQPAAAEGEEPLPPKTFGEAKAEQVGTATLGGAIAGPLMGAAGDIVGPKLSKAVRYLTDRGVKLSPGQTLQGIPNRLESASMSAPISGELVRDVRSEAIPGFNRAAANEALEHIGETIPEHVEAGHDTYNYVEKRISDKYNDIHSRVNVTADSQIVQDLSNVVQDSMSSLPRERVQHLQDLIRKNVVERFADRNGRLTGKELQTVQSKIKELSRTYISSGEKSGNPEHTALGEYLDDARRAIDSLIERQNPAEAAALKATNRAFAHEIILRKATAAKSTQAYNGAFTPNELGNAMSRVTSERARAKGRAFYQDLVEAGKEVIPSRVPDSATAERHAVLGMLGIGGAHAAGFAPQAALGIGAHAVAYSPPAQYLIRNALLSAPSIREPIGNLIRQYGPAAATPLIVNALRRRQQEQPEAE